MTLHNTQKEVGEIEIISKPKWKIYVNSTGKNKSNQFEKIENIEIADKN